MTKFGEEDHAFAFGHTCGDNRSLFWGSYVSPWGRPPTLSEKSGRKPSSSSVSILRRKDRDLSVGEGMPGTTLPPSLSPWAPPEGLLFCSAPLFRGQAHGDMVLLASRGSLEVRPSLLLSLGLTGCNDVIVQNCVCSADPNTRAPAPPHLTLGGLPQGLDLG